MYLAGKMSLYIPAHWMDFFTMMLVQPSSFDCAKQFLKSNAWQYMLPVESVRDSIYLIGNIWLE
jgi:hypothetical protein